MEIPGLGANNPLRLDPGKVLTPQVVPGKVQPQVTEQKVPTQQPLNLPNQAPASPVLNQNMQSVANLLIQQGIPNTSQNNQIAQVLANYGQPINKQTVSQVLMALGPISNQGPAAIEAGVILLMNNLPVNQNNLQAVMQLLNGGLSQNLLGFSKDLQKLVDSKKGDISKALKDSSQSNIISQNSVSSVVEQSTSMAAQQVIGQNAYTNSKDNINRVKQDKSPIKSKGDKIDSIQAAMKNPYEEYDDIDEENVYRQNLNKDESSNQVKKKLIQNNTNKMLLEEDSFNNDKMTKTLEQFSEKAKSINNTIRNLLSINILRDPSKFPVQIEMLRKHYSKLEKDIKDFKEFIKLNFPELLKFENKENANTNEENIFENLLKLVTEEENENIEKLYESKNSKLLLQNKNLLDIEFLKNLARVASNIEFNMFGREILTKSMDCMCVPLIIPYNNELYNAEILIQREDLSNKKVEIGDVPLNIRLYLETKTLGKIGVNIMNFKKDLQISISVDNPYIQHIVKGKINNLQTLIDKLPYNVRPIDCVINQTPDQSKSVLLPKKYKVMSLRRIEGIV